MAFCYTTLLFPDKNGICSYLDGAILMALGLRRQKVKHKIICMVTPDVSADIINRLKMVYDDTIVVDYISPNKGILIDKSIFHGDRYINMFTKLHIFDSDKFPYEKVVFVDNDVIPIKEYDRLFELKTPAGWLEKIDRVSYDSDSNYERVWGVWQGIEHGDKIPKIYTDNFKKPGRDINGGLLVVKPDKNLFMFMLNDLKSHKCKGCVDVYGNLSNGYIFAEQSYLTQLFGGEWRMINGLYASWVVEKESLGVHMANLWFLIDGKQYHAKSWQIQLADGDMFGDITCELITWGLQNYPPLKKFLLGDLKILINDKLIPFKDTNYDILNHRQKMAHKYLFC